MFKDVPTLYKLNPEFYGKVSKDEVGQLQKGQEDMVASRSGKRNKKGGKEENKVDKQVERAKKLEEEGGEVNIIDSQYLALDCEEMLNAIAQIDYIITEN